MAEPVGTSRITKRTRVGIGAGGSRFFVGQVARALGLAEADYSQVGRLSAAARGELYVAGDRRWRRFDFQEVTEIAVAFALAGGAARLAPGKRLALRRVRAVVRVLRDRYKIERPLLAVRLELRGESIMAWHQDICFEPIGGQVAFRMTKSAILDLAMTVPDRGPRYDVASFASSVAALEEADPVVAEVLAAVRF